MRNECHARSLARSFIATFGLLITDVKVREFFIFINQFSKLTRWYHSECTDNYVHRFLSILRPLFLLFIFFSLSFILLFSPYSLSTLTAFLPLIPSLIFSLFLIHCLFSPIFPFLFSPLIPVFIPSFIQFLNSCMPLFLFVPSFNSLLFLFLRPECARLTDIMSFPHSSARVMLHGFQNYNTRNL